MLDWRFNRMRSFAFLVLHPWRAEGSAIMSDRATSRGSYPPSSAPGSPTLVPSFRRRGKRELLDIPIETLD